MNEGKEELKPCKERGKVEEEQRKQRRLVPRRHKAERRKNMH